MQHTYITKPADPRTRTEIEVENFGLRGQNETLKRTVAYWRDIAESLQLDKARLDHLIAGEGQIGAFEWVKADGAKSELACVSGDVRAQIDVDMRRMWSDAA